MSLDDQNDADLINRTIRRGGRPVPADGELPPYGIPEDAEDGDDPLRPRTRVRAPAFNGARVRRVAGRAWVVLLGLALLVGTGIFIGLTIRSQTRGEKTPDVKYGPPGTRPAPQPRDAAPAGTSSPTTPAPGYTDADGDGIDDKYALPSRGAGAPSGALLPALGSGGGRRQPPAGARFSFPGMGAFPVPSDDAPAPLPTRSEPGAEATAASSAPALAPTAPSAAPAEPAVARQFQPRRALAPAGLVARYDGSAEYRHVATKTFRRRDDGAWVDVNFRERSGLPTVEVVAGSPEYRRLLEERNGLVSFFGLADDITVVFEGTVYRVVPQR